MGGTVVEQLGNEASNLGEPSVKVIQVNTDSGEAFSEPILLEGSKVVSLECPTLGATDITFEATSHSTNPDPNDGKRGFKIPLAADFKPLLDQAGNAVVITATTGDIVVALPDVGFAMWVRIVLSVPATATFYLTAKG